MTGTTPSRRQVVRAGAWTVPAVAVATAAPAFAASGANLSTSSGTITRAGGNPQPITINLTIINSGTATTDSLTLTLTVAGLQSATTPSGWTQVSLNTTTGVVTYTRNSQLPGTNGPGSNTTAAGPFVLTRNVTGNAAVAVDLDPGAGGVHGVFTLSA